MSPVRLLRSFEPPVASVRYLGKLGAFPLMLAAAAISLSALAPVIVHDAGERYPLAPAARSTDTRPTVYARAVPSRRDSNSKGGRPFSARNSFTSATTRFSTWSVNAGRACANTGGAHEMSGSTSRNVRSDRRL